MERQYFELQGKILEMAVNWKKNTSDPHFEKVKSALQIFGTQRIIKLSSFFGGDTILAIGDESAPIEGMVPDKNNPGYLKPNLRTQKGKEYKALFHSLTYPEAGEPVLKELNIFHKKWGSESKIYFPSFFQVGDRWFVGVPALHVPDDWLSRKDLIAILPMDLEKIIANDFVIPAEDR